MESIVTALKDLIKYELLRHLNTGDRTTDSLLSVFLFAVVVLLFDLRYKYYWKVYVSKIIDKETFPYFKKHCSENNDKFTFEEIKILLHDNHSLYKSVRDILKITSFEDGLMPLISLHGEIAGLRCDYADITGIFYSGKKAREILFQKFLRIEKKEISNSTERKTVIFPRGNTYELFPDNTFDKFVS